MSNLPDPGPWHIRGIRLPNGSSADEWWIDNGQVSETPILGARTLPGAWVLPGGLVDAHVHLGMDFSGVHLPDGSAALIGANLAAERAHGVLAIRDIGEVPGTQVTYPDPAEGPQLVRAGTLIAPPGRFHRGKYRPTPAADLLRAAEEQIERGAQWVKIIADFPGDDGNWFEPIINYPADAVRALVAHAHSAGVRVAAHVSGPSVADLIRAGVDSIEHGPLMSPADVREMARRGTAWVPTLTTVGGTIEPLAALDAPIGQFVRGVFDQWRTTIPLAVSLGVPVLAGSDETPHGHVFREVAQLHRFGLSRAQAIDAASTVARRYLGLPERPGDLVIFGQDPHQDLQALASPTAVLVRGRLIARHEPGLLAS